MPNDVISFHTVQCLWQTRGVTCDSNKVFGSFSTPESDQRLFLPRPEVTPALFKLTRVYATFVLVNPFGSLCISTDSSLPPGMAASALSQRDVNKTEGGQK